MNLPTLALSFWQPWAFFIVHGLKDVENRTWALPRKYLDLPYGVEILVHASKSPRFSLSEAQDILWELHARHGLRIPDELPEAARQCGGVVGKVRLAGCRQGSASPWASAEPGTWHWSLADAQPLPFMPCPGHQGFFHVTYSAPDAGQGVLL